MRNLNMKLKIYQHKQQQPQAVQVKYELSAERLQAFSGLSPGREEKFEKSLLVISKLKIWNEALKGVCFF